nr:RNA-directed DNA polymerase, eukaryota, reverse transcriptase zinc-binding domain protein [Tanacetum cinerariifolium]
MRAVWECRENESPRLMDSHLVFIDGIRDFRPITLIGSLYKIIAKILANRLVVVLEDIVNEVQSAFVAIRKIVDEPFILNKLLHWCKKKKKQTMVSRVDFEKACDSFRRDYLDGVLQIFGFGDRIHGEDGKLGKNIKQSYPSIWLDIVGEMEELENHDTDLIGFIHKKIGNGADTSFWEDVRRGDGAYKSFILDYMPWRLERMLLS